ncbi:MAG: hypothetical protein J7604_17600 [Sporocytophaga sp.]|uniref:hypothetical protein n=1 Tax=Sporocytophaga sp. TaxID=2231183 RepID=UPI001B160854|nr:hypothetical protein [Sporocytophaga sp.]MBO9702027.1 hypothetical protein [Sporocytophaga sp.]
MMKRILIISFIALISCNTSKNTITGTYQNKGVDFFHSLKLNNTDSTFILTKKYFEVNSFCTGKWQQKGDTIFLKCNEEKDIAVLLSSGYMNQREFRIVIRNKNKLKLDNVVLKRKQ